LHLLAGRLINVDFADIKAVMRNSGTAMLGVGYGVGPDRALQAAYGERQQHQHQRDVVYSVLR
jgi:cell division GTPase FtsZ